MSDRVVETRRDLLGAGVKGLAAVCAAATAAPLFAGPSMAQDADSDYGLAKDAWLDSLFTRRTLVGPLHLSRFVERIYFLTRPIAWTPLPGQNYERVDVPKGFVTDFASIPRPFWALLPPDGEYAYAAVIHDYLYWTQKRPRYEADEILKFAMQDLQVDAVKVATIYGAVWAAGGFAWSGNAALKRQGEKRVLKADPTDPTTRWENWKKKSDVFSD